MNPAKPAGGWAGDKSAEPLWTAGDTRLVMRLAPALALAWALPPAAWDRIAHSIARSRLAKQPESTASQRRWLRTMLGDRLDEEGIERAISGRIAAFRLRQLQIMRLHRPGGWEPVTRVEGGGHVEAARAAGRGAILWAAPFVFASVTGKLACRAAGLEVSHLSRSYHGYTSSRLGSRLLNPIQRRAEDRFLAERVVMPRDGAPVAAMRQLALRLRENRMVSITMSPDGLNVLETPFFAGTLRVANGPVKLALSSGSPLLPLATVRLPDGSFSARIGPALPVARGAGEQTARALASWLEEQALAFPEQFFWSPPTVRGPDGPFMAD